MGDITYKREITALLVIDSHNDFISEGRKTWDRIRAVGEATDCVPHMLQGLNAARNAGLRVFYALHHRYRSGDYETWKYMGPIRRAAWSRKAFEYGTSAESGDCWKRGAYDQTSRPCTRSEMRPRREGHRREPAWAHGIASSGPGAKHRSHGKIVLRIA